MNRILLICVFFAGTILTVSSCKSRSSDDQIPTTVVNNPLSDSKGSKRDNLPVFQFDKETHNFGRVIEGEKVSYSFKFKNVGKSDLLITTAQGSCGCTVPEWPKYPIRPEQEGVITVTFNSSNRKGFQNKTVTIIANTLPNTKVLNIKAEVVAPEN